MAKNNSPVEVDVHVHGAMHLFGQLGAMMGKTVEQVVQMRSPMLARYMASYTQPVADKQSGGAVDVNSVSVDGTGRKARALGQGAVRRDIGIVYKMRTSIFPEVEKKHGRGEASGIYKLMKTGRHAEAQTRLQALGFGDVLIAFDDGRYHQSVRREGRVPKSTRPRYVSDVAALAAYTKRKVALVGYAKSGWISAGDQVPLGEGKGKAPAWMRQGAPGDARVVKGQTTTFVALANRVFYVSAIMSDRTYLLALDQFVKSLAKEVQSVFAHQTAKELTGGGK